jgi:TPR repeat protein
MLATCVVAAMATLLQTAASASGGPMYIPTPCEMEWESIKFVRPLPSEQISRQKNLAEMGDADAQYFMSLAASDREERQTWLKTAIANGSKGAAAYYAYELDERWKTDPVDPAKPAGPRRPPSRERLAELLQPVIDAAEAGDPQAATRLMEMGRARWDYQQNGPHPILKGTDVPKWAAIAARGGNPAAAELLCRAHSRNLQGLEGLEKDDAQAFYWCSIAAPQTCSISAKVNLSELYRKGVGTTLSKEMAEYWSTRSRKAMRGILTERLDLAPLPMSTR